MNFVYISEESFVVVSLVKMNPPKRYIPATGPGRWMELPDNVIARIFHYVEFKKKNWISVLKVCKKWAEIGVRSFDPSVNDNMAIRNAW